MNDLPLRVAVLGSTGSIGRQTLEVLAWHPHRFAVSVLAAGTDSELFREQVVANGPAVAVVGRAADRAWVPAGTELMAGRSALVEVVTRPDVDFVVVATSGIVSLEPTLAALKAGKTVAVANKEVFVSAGHLVTAEARRHSTWVLPIDSEHSAIWQCIRGEQAEPEHDTVRRIILTASGGAFRDLPVERLRDVKPVDALRHPNWAMGPKITVDSATLVNKGLEVLEASWLFGQPLSQVEIIVHRESVIHSMVEFVDHSVKAQLGTPDMRLPIQYALAYPDRLATPTPPLDLLSIRSLSFEPLDHERFPGPGLAYEAGRLGLSYPAVLNAANEEAVRLFLAEQLPFSEITAAIRQALEAHLPVRDPDLEAVLEVDAWARRYVREWALPRQTGVIISSQA